MFEQLSLNNSYYVRIHINSAIEFSNHFYHRTTSIFFVEDCIKICPETRGGVQIESLRANIFFA